MTEATIGATICAPGWSHRVRPPREATDAIKRRMLAERGEPASHAHLYELDHVVPLALGGAPLAAENLQLQPWDEAREKDDLELLLHEAVCAGALSLREARARIQLDWRSVLRGMREGGGR